MHNKLIAGVILLTLIFFVIPVYHVYSSETSIYRFDLAKGKNTDVCRHMHKVYNRYFQRLLDIKKAKPELWDLFTKTYRDIGALNSFYPTSPEFGAVKWDILGYMNPNISPQSRDAVLLAEIDIDNDGVKETVAKRTFYDMGSHYSERLLILSDFKLSESGQVQYDDFYRKQPVSLGYAAIIRPFIYKETTYLHWYEFKLPEDYSAPDPTVYDKWILIRKYLGTRLNKDGYNEPQYRDICEFKVIETNVERLLRNMQKKKGD